VIIAMNAKLQSLDFAFDKGPETLDDFPVLLDDCQGLRMRRFGEMILLSMEDAENLAREAAHRLVEGTLIQGRKRLRGELRIGVGSKHLVHLRGALAKQPSRLQVAADH